MAGADKSLSMRDCVLAWNLMPANYDEAVALVPSLHKVPREAVVKMVTRLHEIRNARPAQ